MQIVKKIKLGKILFFYYLVVISLFICSFIEYINSKIGFNTYSSKIGGLPVQELQIIIQFFLLLILLKYSYRYFEKQKESKKTLLQSKDISNLNILDIDFLKNQYSLRKSYSKFTNLRDVLFRMVQIIYLTIGTQQIIFLSPYISINGQRILFVILLVGLIVYHYYHYLKYFFFKRPKLAICTVPLISVILLILIASIYIEDTPVYIFFAMYIAVSLILVFIMVFDIPIYKLKDFLKLNVFFSVTLLIVTYFISQKIINVENIINFEYLPFTSDEFVEILQLSTIIHSFPALLLSYILNRTNAIGKLVLKESQITDSIIYENILFVHYFLSTTDFQYSIILNKELYHYIHCIENNKHVKKDGYELEVILEEINIGLIDEIIVDYYWRKHNNNQDKKVTLSYVMKKTARKFKIYYYFIK